MTDPHQMSTPGGIGIDLVRIERIAEHLGDDRFLARLFTPGELAEPALNGPHVSRRAGPQRKLWRKLLVVDSATR